ncbi:hypothetical protein PHYSODRAFT_502044 [Phytophthora sojae]|uniref:HTH CENPB-type domain-containing protein n=1 Tax=Phytophthora sojae (strain P6497) TaxID=1094619 RepID=G4ZEN4_PHYSP|nr:hypothetical protein PHYSODRAFT_502044 [Phytophthora sojae]EGZ16557.1 hypothetical protein PHYSODRAFT_502044 [Phytophthora sojae]|eukprot:XP_009525615.1 hypothetical protein PHYSODRAFT_502044 [Phytophthora sojae]
MAEEPKRKDTRTHLTLQQKAQLRAFLAANPKLPRFAVADWVREHFHVRLGRTTLYRIQHTPEAAFATGNLSRKKLRRVKFPDFERRLLAFYEDRRQRREDVSDDELLRQAAECRAACGISDTELKLSNGWLYQDVTLSARALTTVQAPGFFNWEPVGDVPQDEVYCGDRVAGQCDTPTQVESDVASSIWVGANLLAGAQEMLKVEFLAQGYAFSDSSLVLRRRIQ